MRDFRDAKAMAQTLREALETKTLPLTHSESLELIAKVLGFHDWNVLSARIQSESKPAAGSPARPPQTSAADSGNAAHKEITVDTATLDNYTGFYQLNDDAVLTVTREENHLVTRLTGQIAVPFHAESNTEFFATIVSAKIRFVTDAKGQATALVLHQRGVDHTMKRIDAATARAVESRTDERVKSQSASPGTEAALLRLITGLTNGVPDYQEMTPTLAEATRQQLPNLHRGHEELGAVKSVQFLGVGRQGEDVYTVRHENGASHWRIALDAKGMISSAWVNPGP
jgi:hypothetical protein